MHLQRPGFGSASEAFRRISWEDFRLVEAIAACGTLAGAAAVAGMNPSTAFRRLRALEITLATTLFERHRTGYVLTAAGNEVARLAGRLDEEILAVVRNLAAHEQEMAGELRVTMSDSMFTDLLTPILHQFAAKHPKLALNVMASNDPLNLSKGDADVAVRASERPPANLIGRRLARIAWALYGKRPDKMPDDPPDTRSSSKGWVSLAGALGVLPAQQFLESHIPHGRIACRVDSVLCAAAAVESGIGIGYLPCFTGDSRAGLKRLGAPVPQLTGELWLLTHRESRQIPRVRAFLDFVAAEIHKRRALIEGGTIGHGETAGGEGAVS